MTATSTQLALLAAICADPRDDTPRLVYADWLDENGEPARAEFIRVQCELAKPKYRTGNGNIRMRKGKTIRRLERELLLKYEEPWTPEPLQRIVRVGLGGRWAVQREWRRGFVDELRADAATLLGGACELCRGEGGWYTTHPDDDGVCNACNGKRRTEGLARKLIWHPSLTDVCPECDGSGWVWGDETTSVQQPCDKCGGFTDSKKWRTQKGSGRIPRPLSETAQPVTRCVFVGDRTETLFRIGELAREQLGWGVADPIRQNGAGWKQALETMFGSHVEWVLPTEEYDELDVTTMNDTSRRTIRVPRRP